MGMKSILRRSFERVQQIPGVLTAVALVVLLIVFGCLNKNFLSASNILTILLTTSTVSYILIGQFCCIMCGYTDMSVGNVAAFAGVIAGMAVKDYGCSVPVGILLGLLFGVLHGLVTGICIAKYNCNSWVTTYALMQVYRGVIFLITGGVPVALPGGQSYTQAFRFLGQYKLFGAIQFPIVMMIVLLAVFAFILKYTRTGRNLYCVGNSPEAARVSGINVKATIVFGYLCVGVMSALAGITFGSRVYSMQPNAGATYGMDTIAACVVGGTRMSGGKGNVIAAMIGLLVVYVIQNGLIMCGLDAFYHYIVTGLIMFLAVLGQTVKVRKV